MRSGDRRHRTGTAGRSMIALSGGALALNLILVLGLLGLIAWQGMGCFWQQDLAELTLEDGTRVAGELVEEQEIPGGEEGAVRVKVKVANRDVDGVSYRWIPLDRIRSLDFPGELVLLEREGKGAFIGRMTAIRRGEEELAQGPAAAWETFRRLRPRFEELRARRDGLLEGPIRSLNQEIRDLRLEIKAVRLRDLTAEEERRRVAALEETIEKRRRESATYETRLQALYEDLGSTTVLLETAGGTSVTESLGAVIRGIRPNRLGFWEKVGLYFENLWLMLSEEPRESNTAGGVFPAIFGTVLMVFIMTLVVVPLGVLAAVYLREYARQGIVSRLVRIAVNNLAGTPSIVFGVFGLGFFVYFVGGTLDDLFFPEYHPEPKFGTGGVLWASLTLALLTLPVVIVATEEGLASVPRSMREGSLALGATKWETLRRVILPASAPGILTGTILAVARAAGEVAPLMLVGVVKTAPALPVDSHPPFVHLERKFMHLGFHIFDLQFQSPDVEAAKPLVYATAFILIAVVTLMNLVAIVARNRLRRGTATSAV